ncbi:MAG: hypothetical protein JNM17_14375, partial [Archangium sp.]|nr:hypothetical protein [Archangium sp.]
HLHHADGANSYLTDSSIWQSNWRSVVVHRTNDTLVSRNVAFDVFGHSFYLEDGVEVRNELSFNLAARTKIMGPTDSMSLALLNPPDQWGQTLLDSPTMVQPADRAAAGFYISNGNNRIVGNAASGGFAGFTFPSVPIPTGGPSNVRPLDYAVSSFDGNSAHTAGYFWWSGACVYVGGVLDTVDVGGVTRLRYLTGRTTDWNLLRHGGDIFNNTRTFQCPLGINHWGSLVRVVNFESYDNELLGALFGSASIQSAVVVASSQNTQHFGWLQTGYYRGFQFYDTGTQTVLSDVVFRNFQPVTPGMCNNCNNCALLTMVHSDEFTPQNMNATQRLYFDAVHESVRFCSSNTGTLASRNFNLYDSDGSATRLPGDGLPMGARLVGSGYSDSWRINTSCVRQPSMNMWLCPMSGTYEVASIGVTPNRGVRSTTYSLTNGAALGDNWYSTTTSFDYAQLTGPARFGWHHSFPGGVVPPSFAVQVKQVPLNSFVVMSFSLPPGVQCSVAGWTQYMTVAALLGATGAGYATDRGTCFLRIPPTPVGFFQASMLRVQNQTWSGNPTPTTYFTVQTGCSSAIPACQMMTSTLPTLP